MWVKKYPGQLQNENERFFQEIYFLPLEILEPIPICDLRDLASNCK